MKLYCVFIRGKNLNKEDYPGISDIAINASENKQMYLYGITNKKKIANEFISQRNDGMFYLKKYDVSDEFFKKINNEYDNYFISYHTFKYQNTKKDTYGNKVYVSDSMEVLTTEREFDIVYYDAPIILSKISSNLISLLSGVDINILNDTLYKIFTKVFSFYGVIDWINELENAPFGEFDINTLSLYFYLFGNTYKK